MLSPIWDVQLPLSSLLKTLVSYPFTPLKRKDARSCREHECSWIERMRDLATT